MRTERILSIIAFAALVLKFLHLPGGNMFFVIAMGALSMLYFYGAFYFFSEKKLSNQKIGLTIPAGLLFAMVIIGIMFKLQFWPEITWRLYLLMGLIFCVVISGFVYFLRKKAETEEMKLYYKRMMRRTVVMFFLSGFFLFIPSTSILSVEYRDPTEAQLRTQLYFNSHSDSDRDKAEQRLHAYIHERDSLAALKK